MERNEIPDAELDVLAVLWHRGASTAREIRETLEEHRPMTHGAVSTLLNRLESKEFIQRTQNKVGKAFVFRARIKPAPTYRRKVGELMERLFGGDSVALVHSLFETHPPDDQEIEELQRLLDDWKQRRQAEGESSSGASS